MVAKDIINYINKEYTQPVFILGLSFGAVLAIKIASMLEKKISGIFILNPFYSRKEILNKTHSQSYFEEICVKDFIFNDVRTCVIVSKKDNKINPENSKKDNKINPENSKKI